MKFEWDEAKRISNLAKHDIDFADAVGVFFDDLALTITDSGMYCEHRFVTLGIDHKSKMLVVVNMQRDNDVIRIISARKATKRERKTYEG